jgi:hypothetical protein
MIWDLFPDDPDAFPGMIVMIVSLNIDRRADQIDDRMEYWFDAD